MKNKALLLLLALLCACLPAAVSLAGDVADVPQYGIIQGGSLHMREYPAADARVTATYDGGTWVQVVAEAENGFYQVIAEDGREGYMMAGYILPDTLAAGDWGTVENGGRYVNLRADGREDGEIIGHLATGDRFELLAYGDAYAMVRVAGDTVGYVATKLINLDGETDWMKETTHTTGGEALSLHAAPFASGEVLGTYRQGTEAIILIKGENFSKVFIQGQLGYMYTQALVQHKAAHPKATAAPTATPHVGMQPPHYQDNPALVTGPGPAGPALSGDHPRGNPLVVSYDFTPSGAFHDGTGGAATEDQLDG